MEIHRNDGTPVHLARLKVRQLLALMLLNSGVALTVDRIVTMLWSDLPPVSARGNVKTYVSMLREKLAGTGASLVTVPNGYRLDLSPGHLDVASFDALRELGTMSIAGGDDEAAVGHLGDALRLWRGSALQDIVEGSDVLSSMAEMLNERRITVVRTLASTFLRLGRGPEAIDHLRVAVSGNPVNESLWGDLMVALCQEGRRGDALMAYAQCRAVLSEALGVEPSHHLASLHQRILITDPVPAGVLTASPSR
ncbi:AfsR/SARP family transcriptional regulator [Microbispora sp. NPDC088329]|uniref:AfsR/SARP family transcriptional regulator n=1 Tax=Microbispora sp. NPDC088329 TaxID=3154869 RepID=UPI0034241B9C